MTFTPNACVWQWSCHYLFNDLGLSRLGFNNQPSAYVAKQAVECCYFLDGSFSELANPLCLSISDSKINCVIYEYFFCVYWSKCCVYTCMYRQFTSAGMRDTCIWTLMCLKLCSMKVWPCLGSILKQKQNCLQGSDTNLEFNTWPTPM